MAVELIERCPTAKEYLRLRQAAGWHALDEAVAAQGLAASLYGLSAAVAGRVIGCGRVVGDGAVYFYLQDLLVMPEYRGRGLGTRIMTGLMDYVRARATRGSFVGLMAAPGLDGFYAGFGFVRFPADSPAMLIWL